MDSKIKIELSLKAVMTSHSILELMRHDDVFVLRLLMKKATEDFIKLSEFVKDYLK